jgi:dethiobiotin synthetase
MTRRIYFVTATDTGAGKTVLTVSLTHYLVARGLDVTTLKPFCSGSRADAVAIRRSLGGGLTLDEINPWHFRAALAPAVAARIEGRRISPRQVIDFIRGVSERHAITLVEGAGGLLSPLTEDLDASQIIKQCHAIPIVVCPNRLGAINQTLLVLDALPASAARKARVVLMSQRRRDASAKSNHRYLRKMLGPVPVLEFPWLSSGERREFGSRNTRVRRVLDALTE